MLWKLWFLHCSLWGVETMNILYNNRECSNAPDCIVLMCADGFSPFPSILAYFPDLSDVGLPPPWDVEQSLKPDSPTILYDVSAGKCVCVCLCEGRRGCVVGWGVGERRIGIGLALDCMLYNYVLLLLRWLWEFVCMISRNTVVPA